MKLFLPAILLLTTPVMAVPVVPNFSTGTMSSHTETKQSINETIHQIDYRTGWELVITGTNVHAETLTTPTITTTTTTSDGVQKTWTGLDLQAKPKFSILNPGKSFQFTETYYSPGLSSETIITRVTETESVTDTTSTFSQ